MTPIEIIAFIFAIAILTKITLLFTKPEALVKAAEFVEKKPTLAQVIYLLLAGIIGYYILQVLTVVHVAAVLMFIAPILAVGFMAIPHGTSKLRKQALKAGIDKFWLYILIWAGLALWVLWEVLL